MRKLFYTLVLLVTVVLFGCSQSFIYQLKSEDTKVDYYKGEELMAREDSLLFTQVGFLDNNNGEYRFFLNLINYSGTAFSFNPADITLQEFSRDSSGAISEGTLKIKALDPEKQLQSLEASKAAGEKLHTVLSFINIITGVASVAVNASDTKHPAAGARAVDAVINTAVNQAELNEGLEDNNARIMFEKERWEYDILHKTDVAPGDTLSGYIIFPKKDEKSNLFLSLPLAGTEHRYFFRRVKIPVR